MKYSHYGLMLGVLVMVGVVYFKATHDSDKTSSENTNSDQQAHNKIETNIVGEADLQTEVSEQYKSSGHQSAPSSDEIKQVNALPPHIKEAQSVSTVLPLSEAEYAALKAEVESSRKALESLAVEMDNHLNDKEQKQKIQQQFKNLTQTYNQNVIALVKRQPKLLSDSADP